MSENRLRAALGTLERKLILLISNYQKQKNEVAALKEEVRILKAQNAQKDERLTGFQNKDKISKIASGMIASEGNPKELGNMLDEYIKEVDKCIAQLSE